MTPLLIDLSGPLPHAHSFAKMKLEIPVNRKFETFNLTLYPAKVVGNAREVKNMYATPVAKIPPNELQIFFQKAWGVATNRMERLNDDWSCLHDYDVQAVFVFLQAYRELSRKLNMIPNTSIYPYTSWDENGAHAQAKPCRSRSGRGPCAKSH